MPVNKKRSIIKVYCIFLFPENLRLTVTSRDLQSERLLHYIALLIVLLPYFPFFVFLEQCLRTTVEYQMLILCMLGAAVSLSPRLCHERNLHSIGQLSSGCALQPTEVMHP